jgi:iron-sulfur cluster repair protein YtfE (RIC family)
MEDDPTRRHPDTASDVVELIRQQHDMIRSLFADVAGCAPTERREPFEALVRLLAVHETAEEMVVYPDLRATGDRAATIVEARTNEEDAAKKALADLEGMDTTTAEFEDAFAAFRDEVETHADREEWEVLPLLEEFDERSRTAMGRRFTLAESMAPTHAHRLAPESALGTVLVGPFVAMVDRVRDAIRDATRDEP